MFVVNIEFKKARNISKAASLHSRVKNKKKKIQ